METSHEHTACHSLEVFIPNRFKLFLGHQRIYWKRTSVMQQDFFCFLFFFKRDFFYINSRFGLLCNLSYSDCFTNWDEKWLMETLLYKTTSTVTFPCDLDRICNFFVHKQLSLTWCIWSSVCLTSVLKKKRRVSPESSTRALFLSNNRKQHGI